MQKSSRIAKISTKVVGGYFFYVHPVHVCDVYFSMLIECVASFCVLVCCKMCFIFITCNRSNAVAYAEFFTLRSLSLFANWLLDGGRWDHRNNAVKRFRNIFLAFILPGSVRKNVHLE